MMCLGHRTQHVNTTDPMMLVLMNKLIQESQ